MGEGLQASLFLGVLISEKMQEHLDKCEPHNERFFKKNESEYLQVTTHNEKTYIGKRLDKRVAYESLADVVSNIMSILRIVCPDYSLSRDQFVLFAEISIG